MESDPERYQDESWDFIEIYRDALKGLVRRTCRGRFDLIDEIWSDVIIARCQECINTWDGVSASLKTHVFGNLRWYIWKWLNSQCRRIERETPSGTFLQNEKADSHDVINELVVHDLVQTILDKLPEYERALLTLYYLEGQSFEEIGDTLLTCKSTARTHVMKALAMAQDLVSTDDDEATS